MEEESEFGKGLVICLVKFAEHFMILKNSIDMYKKSNINGRNLHPESSAVSMWANGATDHLYEIEVPKGKDWDAIRKKVKELQDKGLEMGHGYTRTNYTEEDANYLMKLTREIAMMIDEKIGLKPDTGEW